MTAADSLVNPDLCTGKPFGGSSGDQHNQALPSACFEDKGSHVGAACCHSEVLASNQMLDLDAAAHVQWQGTVADTTAPVIAANLQVEQQKHGGTIKSCACALQNSIPVHHKDNLGYQQFVQEFMRPNLPVMIQARFPSILFSLMFFILLLTHSGFLTTLWELGSAKACLLGCTPITRQVISRLQTSVCMNAQLLPFIL